MRDADEPPIYTHIAAQANSDLVFIADHAGFAIPRCLAGLGLSSEARKLHIAGDHGVDALTRWLAQKTGADALLMNYSRLVVDVNRAVEDDDWIVQTSDGIAITGNRGIDAQARADRKKHFFDPWHAAIEQLVEQKGQHCRVIALHSFTPRLNGGNWRQCQLGFLSHKDRRLAEPMVAFCRNQTSYHVGDNVPYDGRRFNYTLDRHAGMRGLLHISIEIRSDLLADDGHVEKMGHVVLAALRFASQ